MPVSWLRQVDLSELPEFADLSTDELARLEKLVAWLAKLQDCINGRKVRW